MQQSSAELKAQMLAALAHPNRIRIIEHLQRETRCNCELGPALDLEQSNLSRHLKVLVQAGILSSSKEGLRVNFRVADARVFKILDLAAALAKQSIETRADALEEA